MSLAGEMKIILSDTAESRENMSLAGEEMEIILSDTAVSRENMSLAGEEMEIILCGSAESRENMSLLSEGKILATQRKRSPAKLCPWQRNK